LIWRRFDQLSAPDGLIWLCHDRYNVVLRIEQRLQRGHADFACANENMRMPSYGVSPAVRQTGAGAAEPLLAPISSRRR